MKRVMIIDKDSNVTHLAKDTLENLGYDVVSCNNADQAYQKLETETFDLVITDIFLGNEDGLQIISKIASDSKDTKTLAMSGNQHATSRQYLNLATQVGANDVICKPLNDSELIVKVEELIGKG